MTGDELLPGVGSLSVAVTVAVFVTVLGAVNGTLNVTVNPAVAPAASGPMLQGRVPHEAVVDTKSRPAGVGSLTVTFVAPDGPAFVTEML